MAAVNLPSVSEWANQLFSRTSGAPLCDGNRLVLLKDAAENYPAWLHTIDRAQRTIHFEMYIMHEDAQGTLFAEALVRKAAEGVRVRVLYDWMGGFGKTSRAFWNRLRAGSIEVRCYNPPRFDRPLGWLSRDHRKTIVIDRAVAFEYPRAIAYPLGVFAAWVAAAILYRGAVLARRETHRSSTRDNVQSDRQ